MATARTAPGPLRIREIPLGRLHDAPWNANRVSDQTLGKIRRSIRQFGVVENLVVRPLERRGHYEVISGNHRLRLYEEEGLDTAPCHVAELDDAQARLLAQTLNRTRGKDDPEAYAELLREILAELAPADITALLPETEQLIARLVGDAGGADPDLALEPPARPRSRAGEVYELGEHRLMCGDALDAGAVAELLAGARPALLVTDPPYGVELDLGWHDFAATGPRRPAHRTTAIAGDTRIDWTAAYELVPSLEVAYIWHAGQWCDEVGAGLRRAGWQIAQQIIWDKGLFALGRGHYHWQHEACYYALREPAGEIPWYAPTHVPAFYARKPGSNLPWLGGRDQATVWPAASPKMPQAAAGAEDDEYDHPTQKPAELYARPIRNHLEPGADLYDPFVGSGTALIAAELTRRRCLAIEIDPAFCDVARQRYATYTRRPEFAPTATRRRTKRDAA